MFYRLQKDGSVWVRIQLFERSNQRGTSDAHYLVYFPRTHYVFMTRLPKSVLEYVAQALITAFACEDVKQLDIRGSNPTTLADVVFNKSSQVWHNTPESFSRRSHLCEGKIQRVPKRRPRQQSA